MALQAVYAIIGSEPVAIKQALGQLRAEAGAWEEHDAAAVKPPELCSPSLLTDPERPLVRVLSNYPAWGQSQRKQFAELVEELPPGLCVVVLLKQLGVKDPLREVLGQGQLIEAIAPRRGGYARWLQRHADRRGIRLQAQAAERLVELVGEDTAALASELDKLHAVASDGEITSDLVQQLVGRQSEVAAWGWVEAMMRGDVPQALRELAELERCEAEPLQLTGALTSRLLTIAWVQLGLSAEQAQVKPYAWRKAREAVEGRWDRARIRLALRRLAALEEQLKGASALPAQALLVAFTARGLG